MKATALALLLVVLSVPALPQGAVEDPSPPDLAQELATLNATMKRIADLLAAQLDQEGVSLLMKRSELASAMLRQAEDQLDSARGRRESLADEKQRIEARLAGLAAEIESGVVDVEEHAAQLRIATDEMDASLKTLSQRLRSLDAEVIELENRVTSRRSELRDLQDLIDRRLGEW